MNEQRPDIIDRRAIGEITRSGGISNVVSQAEKGILTVIYKQNEPAAIVLPCDRAREHLFTHTSIVNTLVHISRDNSFAGATNSFLENLAELGLVASQMLRTTLEEQNGDKEAIEKYRSQDRKILSVIRKNSSEESGSVSPMTTARADVSTTKHEESASADSSLPRKRGRPPHVIR